MRARRGARQRSATGGAQLAVAVTFFALSTIVSPAVGKTGGTERELVYQRSATSETFVDDAGKYRTRLYAQPIHYKSGKHWLRIDNRLVKSGRSSYALENSANAFHAAFKDNLDDNFLRFDAIDERASVGVSLVGANQVASKPNGGNDGVRYDDVFVDTDLAYRVEGGGVKETLVLRSSAAPYAFTFTVAPLDDSSLTADRQPDGSFVFYAAGKPGPAFSIDAPVVSDSRPGGAKDVDVEGKVDSTVRKLPDGSFRVNLTIDAKWLADPARRFPVYLDPSYNAVTDAQDGFYNETAGGTPNMTGTSLYVGSNSATGPVYGSAVVFDLATIPIGGAVSRVYTNLYLTGCLPGACTAGTTTGTVEMRRLTSGWTSSTAWASITKDSTLLASRSFNAGAGADAINNWYTLPTSAGLASTVQSMINGSIANFGFLLEKSGGNAANGFQFASSRSADPLSAPFLEVYWTANGVALNPSPLLHANGAELDWTRWNGGEGTYAASVMADSPAAYWRLDEYGPRMFDYTANGRDGTYQSGIAQGVPGAIGSNPAVNTSGGRATQNAGSNVPLANSSFTVEFWAKRDASGTNDWAVSQGAATTNAGLVIGFRASNTFTCAFWGNDLDTAATYTDSAWHHWACSYNSANRQRTIYRDGVVVAQATAAANYSGSGAVTIGDAIFSPQLFSGSVDEVAIYTTLLSGTQVQGHYNTGVAPLPGFLRYEIHRSLTSGFTANANTLVGTLTDQALQRFRDTSAKAGGTFYYKVVTVTSGGSYDSNEIKTPLPATGLASVTIQPGFVTYQASGTYIVGSQPNTNERGSLSTMVVDSAPSRTLLRFEIRPIRAGVNITSAALQLYSYQPNVNATIDVHRVQRDWNEGGASWNSAYVLLNWPWTTPGGDFDAPPAATTVDNSPVPHWDSFDVQSLVQDWVNGNKIHWGFILKHHTEAGAPSLSWVADGFARSVALRPKLTVTYEDPSAIVASPEVGINTPAPGALVKGTVSVKAGAGDDSRVASVQFRLDGNNLGAAVTTPPYDVSWDTTTASRGTHALTAVATDDAGNATTSDVTSVTVGNSASPSVSLTTGFQGDATVAGNEITDATRAAGVQGDGRSNDSSFGIWSATTNLVLNGGFESNTNAWSVNGGNGTLTRTSTSSKFGSFSATATTPGNNAHEGPWYSPDLVNRIPVTAGVPYTSSIWLKGAAGGEQIEIGIEWYTSTNTWISFSGQLVTMTNGWQRYALAATAPATAAKATLTFFTQSLHAYTWSMDALQFEQKPFATPYVQTDGAAATRAAGRVRAPASLVDETQGWAAARVRMGFASSAKATSGQIFGWSDNAFNDKLALQYEYGGSGFQWTARRRSGGTGGPFPTSLDTFAAGDVVTVVLAWTSTQLKLSVDGSPFTATNATGIPNLAATLFDIGWDANLPDNEHADSDVLWFAAGTGTLTDQNAATIDGFGNAGPGTLAALPGSASLLWGADTTTYRATQGPGVVLDATASDDNGVARVDFFADGDLVGSDASSPFSSSAPTPSVPLYDGAHSFTAKAYDADGNATTSTAANVTLANTAGTIYKAAISTAAVPVEMRYDPGAGSQDSAPVTVALTNNSASTWSASTVKLRYRWLNPDGSELSNSGDISIGNDLAAGGNRNVSVSIAPPVLPASTMRGRLTLGIDLYNTASSSYFAAQGNRPFEQTLTVTRVQTDELGFERYQQYDGTDLGSGFGASVNLANGNLALDSTLSSEPGIGLDTVVSLSYNSLENGSVSPAGNNWSLAISGLIPFGLPLDIHPNSADTAAGRTTKWIGLVDEDGSYHRFPINAGGNFYDAPPGVHLYLRATGSADANKYWAATKPDRTTFYFDQAGYPTRVEDKDGNALVLTETAVTSGDDAYALAKQITKVTDQGGRDYTISYFAKSDTGVRAVRGKLRSITDHIGHSWTFDYYADGNLMRVTEKGGKKASGSYLADRSVTFSYTNPAGTAPAIATLAGRQSPDPATVQSTRLFGAIDARGNESQFAYVTSGATQWRLSQATDRAGSANGYSYNTGTSTTTVAMPLSRTWSYVFDAQGRVTSIVDPLNGTTAVNWTGDNMVQKVTEPTGGTNFVEYAYNQNGYLTDKWDELRDHTTVVYENLAVDGNDTTLHLSRPTSITEPVGNTTGAKPHDYETRLDYTDATHDRVAHITDAYDNQVTNTYNSDGTLATQQLPSAGDGITRTTTYNTYDLNGIPTKVTDAAGNFAQASYDAGGNLVWEQDPNHQGATPGDPNASTRYYYDSFGRPTRSSKPKSTTLFPGLLIWDDSGYDANDNVVSDFNPRFGTADSLTSAPALPATATTYDAMDRATLEAGPRGANDGGPVQTQTVYDAAGRVASTTRPNGVKTVSGGAQWSQDFQTESMYDVLDRVFKRTEYAVDATGDVDNANSRITTYCYDLAGDLRSLTAPKGAAAISSCPAVVAPAGYTYTTAGYTTKFEYDAAHRETKQTDALGNFIQLGHNENDATISETDENSKTTQHFFDDRGLQTKTVTPFDTSPLRTITEVTNYDALGRAASVVSPRAYDTGGASGASNFLTKYSYDALSRLVKTSLPVVSSSTAVLEQTPYAFWRVGEASGTTMSDSSGNGRNGSYTAGATLAQPGALTGDGNTAVKVNASAGAAASASGISLANQSFTISFWMKRAQAASTDYAIGQGVQTTNQGLAVGFLPGNQFVFSFFNNDLQSPAYTDTNWHLWTVTFDATTRARAIYRDAAQVASDTSASNYTGSGSLWLGSTAWNGASDSMGNGFLDDVGIWQRALTATEVQAQYAAGTAGTQAAYVHQAYDANGNETQVSLATTSATLAGVASADLTTTEYLDTGDIYKTVEGSTGLRTRYDYNALGLQAARYPDATGTPNVIDYSRAMYWEYLPDRLLGAVLDQGGQREIYGYDADANQILAVETSGATNAAQSPLRIERSFDGFDGLKKTRSPETGVANSYLATTYAYDVNGDTTQLVENRKEDTSGAETAAGRTFAYTYDAVDQVTAQTDDFATTATAADDERLTYSFLPTREMGSRVVSKWNGSNWVAEQSTIRTYFDDGELKQLSNYDGNNTLIEQHTLSYVASGVYMNGNRVSDTFKLLGPDATAPCRTSTCSATWAYDGRDRLISEDPGTGSGVTNYVLDTIGNVVAEGATTRVFSGQKLSSQTTGATTSKYLYDTLGNVDCVAASAWIATSCPPPGNANLLEDYSYDYKSRLVAYGKYSSGTQTDSAIYVFDALDRPVSETETHAGASTTTTFRYVGDTDAVSQETVSGGTPASRRYAYDAGGERVTLSDGTNRYSYLYDAHGSASLLIDQASAVKESTGYTAYGATNQAVTKAASGFNTKTNPYKYSGKRFDTGSNTYDMGARRYSTATGRWLQADRYNGALNDLALALDPLSANRYVFTGANPINYIELDGHVAGFLADGWGPHGPSLPPLVASGHRLGGAWVSPVGVAAVPLLNIAPVFMEPDKWCKWKCGVDLIKKGAEKVTDAAKAAANAVAGAAEAAGRVVVHVVGATVKTVWRYTPKNGRELVEVWAIYEAATGVAVGAGLTYFLVDVVCPAAITAGGPVGAAGCFASVGASLALTAGAAAALKKEALNYVKAHRHR